MNLNKLKRNNKDFLQISSTRADSNAISESDATIAQKETRPEESARLELIQRKRNTNTMIKIDFYLR